MKAYIIPHPSLRPMRGGRYCTVGAWCIDTPYGSICVPAGTTTDGASIPRLLWRICGSPWDSPRIIAAIAHDYLYATHNYPRQRCDEIYRDMQICLGVSPWRAWLEYCALRLFGGKAWERKARRTNEGRTC